ncbi:hypothetical protein [Xanthobacter aminoxidans]|uniref:hypothetical protein n=1 Tax=Xanthobacter aminoxidans TaxID=186280 RepID=UPI002022FEF1|nr:hypothetical protein [Xanthobacter aminoxidans]MCL8385854.1 hypothetical protein [Xanthobacter aminoxidans]
MTDTTMDLNEQVARIERAIAETGKLQEETRKFVAEQHKLYAEARKAERDHSFAPWQVAFTGMGAGAALVGATVALMKVLGG